MRVALLTSARAWRGSGTSFANIARGLLARGHTVELLATSPPVTAGFAAQGLPVRELSIHDTGFSEARLLARVLKELGIEALFAEKPRDLRLGALASLVSKFVLVYRHNVGQPKPPSDPVIRLAYHRVGMTIFLTRWGESQALDVAPFMGRPPHRVIYEGVDLELFRPDERAGLAFRQTHGMGDAPFLLAVGALEREKRYDWLLASLARLPGARPPLLVCGEGALAAPLRDQATGLGLDVRWLGFLPPAELAAACNAATGVVHACPVETFGLSVAEAMACGRPVVAVDGGAVAEVLSGSGALAPCEDLDAFARVLQELLTDPARCRALGAAARQRAVEQFSLARMGREYGEALQAAAR